MNRLADLERAVDDAQVFRAHPGTYAALLKLLATERTARDPEARLRHRHALIDEEQQ